MSPTNMLRSPFYILFCAIAIADWLSQCMLTIGTDFFQHGISSRKLWTHYVSSPILSKAIKSDFIMDRAIQVCLEDFKNIAPLPMVKI